MILNLSFDHHFSMRNPTVKVLPLFGNDLKDTLSLITKEVAS